MKNVLKKIFSIIIMIPVVTLVFFVLWTCSVIGVFTGSLGEKGLRALRDNLIKRYPLDSPNPKPGVEVIMKSIELDIAVRNARLRGVSVHGMLQVDHTPPYGAMGGRPVFAVTVEEDGVVTTWPETTK